MGDAPRYPLRLKMANYKPSDPLGLGYCGRGRRRPQQRSCLPPSSAWHGSVADRECGNAEPELPRRPCATAGGRDSDPTGSPVSVEKTRPISFHTDPAAFRSKVCCSRWAVSAIMASSVKSSVRRLLWLFVSRNTNVYSARSRWSWRFTVRIPADRLMSCHWRPSTSPRRSPVVPSTTQRAWNRSPTVAWKTWSSCSIVYHDCSECGTRGRRTPSVTLRPMTPSARASVKALWSVTWTCRTVRGARRWESAV